VKLYGYAILPGIDDFENTIRVRLEIQLTPDHPRADDFMTVVVAINKWEMKGDNVAKLAIDRLNKLLEFGLGLEYPYGGIPHNV
jgi:hypothetical protein